MKFIAMISAAFLILILPAFSQNEMPKPGPELKKMDVFVGSWNLEGEMKPTSMGPGGKMTESEKCEWMEGNFFLVCRADYQSSMGNGSGLAVMGFSSDDKAYTYREYNSWGESMESKGSIGDDTWTWTSDEKMGDKMMKSRFTMKFTADTAYTFTYDMSQDGTKWTTVMEGKATKAK